MVMPPVSVPVLLYTRLLAICRLCPQPWTKIPPPPWELFLTDNPSIVDGLHWKLLGYLFESPGPEVQSPVGQECRSLSGMKLQNRCRTRWPTRQEY